MNPADFITFADFIGQFEPKERLKLALVCNVKIGTTYVWAHRNAIERKYWPDLIASYPALTLPKLLAMESASQKQG